MAQSAPGLGIPLGRIFGIPNYLHSSWFIIFLLITLPVRTQFVSQHPVWTPAQHWILGIVTSMLFFQSVVFHELSYNLVAVRYRIPVDSITLHVFGGLAKIQRKAENALQALRPRPGAPPSCIWRWHTKLSPLPFREGD